MKHLVTILAILSLLAMSPVRVMASGNTYATLDPVNCDAAFTLSGGNLIATHSAANAWKSCKTNISKTTGKWYFEMKINVKGVNDTWQPAVATSTAPNGFEWGNPPPQTNNAYASCTYLSQGFYECQGVETGSKATLAVNDVIGIAFDADGKTVTFYKNNVSQGQLSFNTDGSGIYGGFSTFDVSNQATFNFGATAMAFTAPSGYNQGLYTAGASAAFNFGWLFGF